MRWLMAFAEAYDVGFSWLAIGQRPIGDRATPPGIVSAGAERAELLAWQEQLLAARESGIPVRRDCYLCPYCVKEVVPVDPTCHNCGRPLVWPADWPEPERP